MDRRRAAGVLLALAACFACSAAAPTASNQTALDLYEGGAGGCYYNFQHYGEGDRIMTNEPCLNCTCHNKMLMCYLRVCPFTKAVGQDCTVEKRADQCCPIVTCPDVPVDLLTSTSTTSPAEYGATGLGKVDKYGCSISGKYFPEGSKVPPTPNKPCEHCYCIRNMTTCVMQECTLHVDGCTPIYHKDVCCPVRYSCDHPEDEIPLLDDMSTTVRPTPGFLLTTTTVSPVTQMTQDCVHDDQIFADGTSIKTEKPCEHCYCMKGDIVCVVQECGTPMENEGKNCTSLPPREGQCCPDTYICEGDVISTDGSTEPTTEIVSDKLTTLLPPIRGGVEGSGYRRDESPSTVAPIEPEFEGSGEEKDITYVYEPVTTEKSTSGEEDEKLHAVETDDNKKPDSDKAEITTEAQQTESELDTQTPKTYITSTTPKKEDFEKLTTSEITEEEILAPHDRLTTSAPTDEIYESATTEISEPVTSDSEENIKKEITISDSTSAYIPESDSTTLKPVDDLKEQTTGYSSLTTTPSAEISDKTDKDSSLLPEIATPSSITTQDESITPSDDSSSQKHKEPTTTEKEEKELVNPSSEVYATTTLNPLDKATTEPDHAENTIAVAEEDHTPTYDFAPSTTAKSVQEEEKEHFTHPSENDVTETTADKEGHKTSATTENTISEDKITTEEPDKGLNTIPSEIDEEAILGSSLATTAAVVELKPTDSSIYESPSNAPDIMATKGEQYTVTTEPSFRKEDDIIVSTEKQKEPTTVKPEFVDDGLIPTSSQDDRYNTGSEISHTEDDITTSIPDFVEITEPKESTTETYPQSSIISETTPDRFSEITRKPEYEITSSTEKAEDVSAFIPVVTETHEEASRIPGEGDCLLEGITYRNNSVVPSSNNCHAGCKCVSSIIKCDPIICSPPPSYNGNCQTIYDSPDACCPTYVCDHPRETVPPQSDNQMSGTESPMSRPTIECHGDQCEINTGTQQYPEPNCGPEGCTDTQKPDSPEPSHKEPTDCAGDSCSPSSEECSSTGCQLPTSDDHKLPVQPCQGEECKAYNQPTLPGLQDSANVPCEGNSCQKVDCAGSNCEPSLAPYPVDTKNITSDDCNGDVPCRRKETLPTNEYLPAKCEGSDCVKENEITTLHSIDSSTLKPTPVEITTDIPAEPPKYVTTVTTEIIKEMPTEVNINVEVTETPERMPELSTSTEESSVPLPDKGVTSPASKEQENTVPADASPNLTDSNITGDPDLHTIPPALDKQVTKPVSIENENKPYSTSSDDEQEVIGMTEPTVQVKNVTQDLFEVGEPSTPSTMLVDEYTEKPKEEDSERQSSPGTEELTTAVQDDKTESYVYQNTETSSAAEDTHTEPTDVASSRKPDEIFTEIPITDKQQEPEEPTTDSFTDKTSSPDDSIEITTPRAMEGIKETEEKLESADVSTQKPELQEEEEQKTTHVYDQDVTKSEEGQVTIKETDEPMGVSVTDIPSTDEREHYTPGSDYIEQSSTDKTDLEKNNKDKIAESDATPTLTSEPESSTKPDLLESTVPEKSPEENINTETEPTIIETEGPNITEDKESTTTPTNIDNSKDQKITPSVETESEKPLALDEKPVTGEVTNVFEHISTEIPASVETTKQGTLTSSVDDVTTIKSLVDKEYTPSYDENLTENPTEVTVQEGDTENKIKPTTEQEISVTVGDSIKEVDSTEEPSITENKDIENPISDDLKKPVLINEDDKEVTIGVTESSSSTEILDDKNKDIVVPDTEKPLIIINATDKPIIRDDETKTTSADVREPSIDVGEDKEVDNGNKPLIDKLEAENNSTPLEEKENETIAPTFITEKPQDIDAPEEGSGSDEHLPDDLSKPATTTEFTIEHLTTLPEKESTEPPTEQSSSENPQIMTDTQKEDTAVSEDGAHKTTESNELEITTKPQDSFVSSADEEVTGSPIDVSTIAAHAEETMSDEKISELSTKQPPTEITPVIDTKDQGAGYDTTSEKSEITNALPESQETNVTTEPSELLTKPDKDLDDGQKIEQGRPETSTEKEEKLPEPTTPGATKPAQSYTEEEGSKITNPIEGVTGYPEKTTESESVVPQTTDQDLNIANTTPRLSENPISDTDLEYATTLPSVEKQTLISTESATTEHSAVTDSESQKTPETIGYTASEELATTKPDLMDEQKPITEIPQKEITEPGESNTVPDSDNLQTPKDELKPTITDTRPSDVSTTSTEEETKVTIPDSVTSSEPHDLATTESTVELSTVFKTPSVEPSDHFTSEAPLSLATEDIPVDVTESELQPETMPQDEKMTEPPVEVTQGEILTSEHETHTESSSDKPYTDSVLPEITTKKHIDDMVKPTVPTIQSEFSETTPYLIELEEHSHKIQDDNTTPTTLEETTLLDDQLSTTSPLNIDQDKTVRPESETEIQPSVTTEKEIETETGSRTTESPKLPTDEGTQLPTEHDKESDGSSDTVSSTTFKPLLITEETTVVTKPQVLVEASTEIISSETSETEKPKDPNVSHENVTPEEEFMFATTKATTIKQEDEQQKEQFPKPEEKPSDSEKPQPPPTIPEETKPGDIQPTDEVPPPEEDGHFPPSGNSGYGEPDYPEEDQAFGPGTCRYGGKVYVSAQQIPRDDPCDFCFCFRSDIICLQQSCPPPIHGCHEEPIQGFCCPRYECPVSMATSVNVTTTTTTTTTTLPPHFLAHAYKGAAQRRGCQIKGHTYKVGEVVRSSSGPCLHCTCGGDGQMKCDPKACTPEPMLRQMIAAAVSAKRRR